MKSYRFVGDGLGVPGLPHELTDEDAAELGVVDLLEEAVKNGNYEILPASQVAPKSKSKSKDEVNNGQ